MTPRDYAKRAAAAYSATPSIGKENDAARIVLGQTELGLSFEIPGTNNFACLEADVDALLHDAGPCGRVHAGIWNAFDAIWPEASKFSPCVLLGHSEGAAGAIYLGARFCLAGRPPKVIHAFEPPRTSIDTKLADIFRAHGVEVCIYHHGRDVVPLVPVPIPGEDWKHAAPVIQFGKASSIFPNIEDHMIEAVIADL